MPAPALRPAAGGSTETARRVIAFMREFSIETARLAPGDTAVLSAVLPARTPVYLTALSSHPQSGQIECAARLRAAGFEPIPHLAARDVASADSLGDALSRITGEAGARRVLVIGGDRDQPAGPFGSALELIESGLLQRYGVTGIGIAGYPEGHPRLTADMLDRALAAKVEAAEQTGLQVHIVTQFAFDPAAILRWLARLRDLGIEHPVRLGMAGPASLSTLLRYAQRCGVRASARGLTRQAGLIKHLIGSSAPDGIVRPLAEAQAAGRPGRVAAHFYSLGNATATARWATAVAAGRIVPDRADGFGVEPP